jgi:hypothetical protein
MSILTKDFGKIIANSIISEINSQSNTYYVWFGYTTPWPDDNNPPPANNSFDSIDIKAYVNISYGQLLTPQNVSLLVNNNKWSNGTVYTQFDNQDGNIFDKPFYIVTSLNNVYKCLFNNNDNPSLIEPISTGTNSVFQTADGYIWKYLYTIDNVSDNNFTTNTHIALLPNTLVQAAAVPGAIYAYQVTNVGSNYTAYNSDYLTNISNSTVLVLGPSASPTSGLYTNSSIIVQSYWGRSQIIPISDYNGSSKTVTLSTPLDIETKLQISNNTGTFQNSTISQSISTVVCSLPSNTFNLGANCVQSDTGAYGNVIAVSLTGTGVTLTILNQSSINFSPSLPVDAQVGSTVQTGTVSCNTTNTTVTGVGTTFSSLSGGQYVKIGSQFRRITTISNNTILLVDQPFSNSFVANTFSILSTAASVTQSNNYVATGTVVVADLNDTQLSIANVTGLFSVGEIFNTSSAANGIIAAANNTLLILTQTLGSFNIADTITGLTSNAFATITAIQSVNNIIVQNVSNKFISGAPIVSSTGGQAVVSFQTQLPDNNAYYMISPTVTINGDGSNAKAYALVNTSSNTISHIIALDAGKNYSTANVQIVSNTAAGSGATARALLSPSKGHGADIAEELGATTLGITVTILAGAADNYYFPISGQYRQFGIIKNPLFNNIKLKVNQPTSAKFYGGNVSGSFTQYEMAYQPSTNASGIVAFNTNTNYLELKHVMGTFQVSNSSNSNTFIHGYSSGAQLIVNNYNYSTFYAANTTTYVQQQNTNAVGIITYTDANNVIVTNAQGQFVIGQTITSNTTNSIANVTGIYNSSNVAFTFTKFNQLGRITLSSNTGAFLVNETISQNNKSTALVVSANSDQDLAISNVTGTFFLGETIKQVSGAPTGSLLFSNSSYMKLSSLYLGFANGVHIQGNTSGATATISTVYPVLIVGDVTGTWINSTDVITGKTSGSQAVSNIANTVTNPDLVRNSGDIIYIENISPITRDAISQQTLQLAINI